MINIWILFSIILMHWIADFILQTDEQAKGKSKSWGYLLGHTITYSMCWFLPMTFIYGVEVLMKYTAQETIPVEELSFMMFKGVLFVFVTFVLHTTTDYFTSRLNSRLWEEKRVHDFFVSVGFDQVLHYVQLILTYYCLSII